ncbi:MULTISPECIES: hypothetical protein [Nocardioides]|jgi:hypothetical protein|uniref:Multi-ubiquitin domain-containing protein n=1 Tax=Nocardioides oceani TaxID=3058369 RepID=A0ABT8FMD4_9ACTN|nr:hypothetical protein [Nocardioides oceani]MDN4175833.1 hypothetical protein [Nocardioides oceani]
MTNDKKPPQTITFTVDNVEFTVSEKHQTAGAILTLAGLDPAMYDLAKLHGDGEAFKDDQQVIVQDGDDFVTVRASAPVA